MTPSDLSFNQPVDVESNEITTVDLLSLIKRPGIDSLIDYLGDSDSYSKYITCTKCSGPVDKITSQAVLDIRSITDTLCPLFVRVA